MKKIRLIAFALVFAIAISFLTISASAEPCLTKISDNPVIYCNKTATAHLTWTSATYLTRHPLTLTSTSLWCTYSFYDQTWAMTCTAGHTSYTWSTRTEWGHTCK